MKKLILFGLILAIPSILPANDSQSKTTESCFACANEQYLDDFLSFLESNDNASAHAYTNDYKCFWLKPGVPVTVLQTSSDGKILIENQGIKMWTHVMNIDNIR